MKNDSRLRQAFNHHAQNDIVLNYIKLWCKVMEASQGLDYLHSLDYHSLIVTTPCPEKKEARVF